MVARPLVHGGGRFAGRVRELRLLREMRAEVAAGGSAAVAVVGEPGIGKTRLTRELSDQAVADGFRVLSGRGSEFEQDVPFGLAIDVLDPWLATVGPDVARLGPDRAAELTSVFPALGGSGRPSSQLETERFRTHYAVRAALERLVSVQPVLLVFDDLHWADPASLELVAHLLRRPVGAIMLVVAFRRYSLVAETAFGRATQEAGMRTLELGPLSATELAEAVGDQPDSAQVRALHAESGGNPFYFTELVRTPTPGATAPPGDPADPATLGFGVPNTVRGAIHRELKGLSAPARTLAQAAAVLGEPFEVALAAAVADLAETVAFVALDELVATGLVQPTAVPDRLVFRHPIVRRAVYDTTGPGWRLAAHRLAATELTSQGAPLSARAHHVERSASQGDEEAVELLESAGHAAAPRAPAAAARWFAGAARLLPPAAPPHRWLDILLPLATAYAAAGRPQDGREVLVQARGHVPPDDPALRGRITSRLADADQALGRSEEANALLTEALAQAPARSADAAALTIELALNHSILGNWAEAVRIAGHAGDAAQEVGDRSLVAAALVASGYALLNVGEYAIDAARENLQQAAGILAELSDDDLTSAHLATLARLALAETVFRDYGRAQAHAEQGLRLCRTTGRADMFLPCMLVLASTHTMRGDLEQAAPVVDAAVEAAVLLDSAAWIAPTEAMRCWMLTQQGRMTKALAAGRNAARAVDRAPQSMFWWVAHLFHGTALIEAGQHQPGRAALFRAGGPDLSGIPPTSRPFTRNVLVRSYVATGDLREAHDLVEGIRRIESELGELLHPAEAHDARATLLLATGDPAAAVREARAAIACHAVGEMYIEEARARILAGRALVADGRTKEGEQELLQAHDTLTSRGAARLADRAAKELRALGRTVRGRSQPADTEADGADALTDREREVAELVTQGSTNRQIAGQLFISPKTVEAHLARVFAKLGVGSRAAMVAALTREPGYDRQL